MAEDTADDIHQQINIMYPHDIDPATIRTTVPNQEIQQLSDLNIDGLAGLLDASHLSNNSYTPSSTDVNSSQRHAPMGVDEKIQAHVENGDALLTSTPAENQVSSSIQKSSTPTSTSSTNPNQQQAKTPFSIDHILSVETSSNHNKMVNGNQATTFTNGPLYNGQYLSPPQETASSPSQCMNESPPMDMENKTEVGAGNPLLTPEPSVSPEIVENVTQKRETRKRFSKGTEDISEQRMDDVISTVILRSRSTSSKTRHPLKAAEFVGSYTPGSKLSPLGDMNSSNFKKCALPAQAFEAEQSTSTAPGRNIQGASMERPPFSKMEPQSSQASLSKNLALEHLLPTASTPLDQASSSHETRPSVLNLAGALPPATQTIVSEPLIPQISAATVLSSETRRSPEFISNMVASEPTVSVMRIEKTATSPVIKTSVVHSSKESNNLTSQVLETATPPDSVFVIPQLPAHCNESVSSPGKNRVSMNKNGKLRFHKKQADSSAPTSSYFSKSIPSTSNSLSNQSTSTSSSFPSTSTSASIPSTSGYPNKTKFCKTGSNRQITIPAECSSNAQNQDYMHTAAVIQQQESAVGLRVVRSTGNDKDYYLLPGEVIERPITLLYELTYGDLRHLNIKEKEVVVPDEVVPVVAQEENSVPVQSSAVDPEENSAPTESLVVEQQENPVPVQYSTVEPEESLSPIESHVVEQEGSLVPAESPIVEQEESLAPTVPTVVEREESFALTESLVLEQEKNPAPAELAEVIEKVLPDELSEEDDEIPSLEPIEIFVSPPEPVAPPTPVDVVTNALSNAAEVKNNSIRKLSTLQVEEEEEERDLLLSSPSPARKLKRPQRSSPPATPKKKGRPKGSKKSKSTSDTDTDTLSEENDEDEDFDIEQAVREIEKVHNKAKRNKRSRDSENGNDTDQDSSVSQSDRPQKRKSQEESDDNLPKQRRSERLKHVKPKSSSQVNNFSRFQTTPKHDDFFFITAMTVQSEQENMSESSRVENSSGKGMMKKKNAKKRKSESGSSTPESRSSSMASSIEEAQQNEMAGAKRPRIIRMDYSRRVSNETIDTLRGQILTPTAPEETEILNYFEAPVIRRAIVNRNTLCYAISLVQLLLRVPQVYSIIRSHNHIDENTDETDCFLCMLGGIISDRPRSDDNPMFVDILKSSWKNMEADAMHCVMEAMEHFINRLDAEFMFDHPEYIGQSRNICSPIRNFFYVESVNNYECTWCTHEHVVADKEIYVSVDLTKSSERTMQGLINHNMVRHVVNGMKCPGCKNVLSNTIRYTKLPEVLLYFIPRVRCRRKVKDMSVVYVQNSIIMKDDNGIHKYALCSFIVHCGNHGNKGHYKSFEVDRSSDVQYNEFDDARVFMNSRLCRDITVVLAMFRKEHSVAKDSPTDMIFDGRGNIAYADEKHCKQD
ncbi:hypothetical protein CAEBREN_03494 [Caenorhabditis brenneri]|uniref:USP domain-containing protein n=1 Tax=Caenorhabditis brenneri TaxID=135651 RepID=G0MI10_CAEBE|nr:hypothetical protein CAEBREN_03494 [Caenorhabditis brenneri]